MINIELSRNQHRLNPEITGFRIDITFIRSIRKYCTAQCTTEDLFATTFSYTAADGTEKTKIKNPKLCELYNTIFGYVPDGLHDAFNDTLRV
jgi:hypothetical protein